jgi:general secretion pathway protein I
VTIKPSASMRGFTLLEVLLAVGLLAITAALVISVMSGGLRQVAWSTQASEASMHAQSLLDTLGTIEGIEPGNKTGQWEKEKFRYQLSIKEITDPSISAETPISPIENLNPPKLYRIDLHVVWGQEKPAQQLHFVSIKVRQAQPENYVPTL